MATLGFNTFGFNEVGFNESNVVATAAIAPGVLHGGGTLTFASLSHGTSAVTAGTMAVAAVATFRSLSHLTAAIAPGLLVANGSLTFRSLSHLTAAIQQGAFIGHGSLSYIVFHASINAFPGARVAASVATFTSLSHATVVVLAVPVTAHGAGTFKAGANVNLHATPVSVALSGILTFRSLSNANGHPAAGVAIPHLAATFVPQNETTTIAAHPGVAHTNAIASFQSRSSGTSAIVTTTALAHLIGTYVGPGVRTGQAAIHPASFTAHLNATFRSLSHLIGLSSPSSPAIVGHATFRSSSLAVGLSRPAAFRTIVVASYIGPVNVSTHIAAHPGVFIARLTTQATLSQGHLVATIRPGSPLFSGEMTFLVLIYDTILTGTDLPLTLWTAQIIDAGQLLVGDADLVRLATVDSGARLLSASDRDLIVLATADLPSGG